MRWTDEGHRKTHRCRNPTSFSTTDQRCGMRLLSPTRKLCVLPGAPYLCGSPSNRSLAQLNLHRARVHRNHGRPRPNGFTGRAQNFAPPFTPRRERASGKALALIRNRFAVTKGRYTFSVEQPGLNDLTNISFDEFVPLIFERAMPPEAEKVDLSFHYVEVELDAKKICAYYVRLFREPEFLLSRFTKQQLEGGFWAIMGHTHEWSAGNIIEYSDAPLSSRRECIVSMSTP